MTMEQRNRRRGSAQAAKRLLHDLLEHPDRYPDDFVNIPLDEEVLPQILTPQRIRLLRVLRDEGPFDSVTSLAERLQRDVSRVSRDLTTLDNLVELERTGKAKRVSYAGRPILIL